MKFVSFFRKYTFYIFIFEHLILKVSRQERFDQNLEKPFHNKLKQHRA